MVTFSNVGRLGNFMFQCSAALAYSLKHNLEFTVPFRSQYWPLYFPHLRNKKYRPTLPKIQVYEQGHEYQEIPFNESWRNKNIVLNGYWQSERYFKDYREDILKALNIPYEFKEDVVSIHIRRTDYLNPEHLDKHPVCSISYLTEAMKMFFNEGYARFLVFSDDMQWCKQNLNHFHFYEYNIEYSEGKTALEDLALMSSCEHNIIANSSFSLWAYLLNQNPNKICIAPKVWFGKNNGHLNCRDIYPENSIII